MNMRYPTIAITLGDPGGIGPEVTVKALARLKKEPAFRRTRFILIGLKKLYESLARKGKLRLKFEELSSLASDPKFLSPGVLYVLDMGDQEKASLNAYSMGKVSRRNAILAYASLNAGAYLATSGLVQGLVTSPVHKEAMRLVDRKFVGHTEYLAAAAKVRKFAMMFDAGRLKVTLVTIHVPLKRVSASITQEDIMTKIRLTHQFLRRFYGLKKPRIAVSALNPHGKEFGLEEERKIVPAVRVMRKRNINVTGPLPGDTVFYEAYRGHYDAVIAMYHDQGLAPLKTVAFDRAVNVTLGLPFVRTSPDHGTAFNLAGKNLADGSSMLAAIQLACRLSTRLCIQKHSA